MGWTETGPTGKTRHRKSLLGKCILQVQVEEVYYAPLNPVSDPYQSGSPWDGSTRLKWRDARFNEDTPND